MKNTVVLSGRLPMFEGKYTPANGDKKSRMSWAINVQLNTKNEQGYYDEALIYFTAWGYYADQLQQISSLAKDDPIRKEYTNISITGRMNAGYKDKDGNIVNSVSIDISEFEFTKRLPSANTTAGDQAFAPSSAPAGTKPGVSGTPAPTTGPGRMAPGMGTPGMSAPTARPGVPGAGKPRF